MASWCFYLTAGRASEREGEEAGAERKGREKRRMEDGEPGRCLLVGTRGTHAGKTVAIGGDGVLETGADVAERGLGGISLEPRVVQCLLGGETLVGVDDKQRVDEVDGCTRCGSMSGNSHCLALRCAEKGWEGRKTNRRQRCGSNTRRDSQSRPS